MPGVVAIVGRPNVGKSALFNRLIGRRLAIVDQMAGVTRDRLSAPVEWCDVHFELADTGGIVPDPREPLIEQVRLQAEVAITEADVVLFVCDAQSGLTALDLEVAELLRAASTRVVCVANKCDNDIQDVQRHELSRLGFGEVFGVSALHGLGIHVLLDEVIRRLPAGAAAADESSVIRVAIVGKPNVGKSSFVNALLKQKRLVVDATPGTTRDAVDVAYRGPRGERFVLIDTAGLKRKKSTRDVLDKYSAIRTESAIGRADVTILILDASAGVTTTDAKIAHLIEHHQKGCVLVVNKWDLVAAPTRGVRDEAEAGGTPAPMRQKEYTPTVFERVPFLNHCPVIYTVATKGTNVGAALGRARKVFEAGGVKLGTGRLNALINRAMVLHQPPVTRNRRLKIFYATQIRGNPPSFVLFVNEPRLAKPAYLGYLRKKIREVEPYEGNPIMLRLRAR